MLRDAVLELSATMANASSDEVYAELNSRLKDRFIDYKPGPDIRRFADAIAAHDIDGNE